MSDNPRVRRNPNGTWSHHRDSKRKWADEIGCRTDLRFAEEWARESINAAFEARAKFDKDKDMNREQARSRVVTLTDQSPVRIIEADWPTTIQGTVIEGQLRADIRIREHADGRILVYGTADDQGDTVRAGFLLTDENDDDPTWVIRQVAEELIKRSPTNPKLHKAIMRAADEAVAKLPLEDI